MTVERLDYAPAQIAMHCTTEVERTKRLRACAKEPETVEFIESLPHGSSFYDIGANTGAYSFVASAVGHRVYAFEPPGPTFDRLEQNIDINPHLPIFAYDVLLGDANAPVEFSYSSLEPGAALHGLGAGGLHVSRLEMRTLDLVVAALNIPYPDAMKIDVDGAELRILLGAEICLQKCSSLLIEIDDSLPISQRVQPFLEARGFKVTSTHPHVWSGIANTRFDK